MNNSELTAHLVFDETAKHYLCEGNWSINTLKDFVENFKKTPLPKEQTLTISGAALGKFDSAGALALHECIHILKKKKNQISLVDFSEQHQNLVHLIENKREDIQYSPPHIPPHSFVYQIGVETFNKLSQVDGLIVLIGGLTDNLFQAFADWRRFQFPSLVSIINSAGLRALPIVGLLSFLIGVVLAYQMGLQLETYGANNFIAYLSGMAIFREFAPLITAIIVAGRTSSSFTAQIGSMVINEEIDAINTMGLSPIELIVVPKVLGLLLVFPLLIFWSDFFSTLGAMLMSKFMLNVGYFDFLTHLQDSVGLKQMMLGLYKAPAFALLISLVGCFQGFRVQSNADSVGTQTTKSVVQALFLIIVADAIYSIIYSWLDL